MEQLRSTSTGHDTAGYLHPLLTDRGVVRAIPEAPPVAIGTVRSILRWRPEEWRRRSYGVLAPTVVVRHPDRGPEAPPEWASTLHQLAELARTPVPAPSWWTPATAFYGNIETRLDPNAEYLYGMPSPDASTPALYLQLSLAGWGCFQTRGDTPRQVGPGKAFFALLPSQHRCYLPKESPGWTFAWIAIYHPYLRAKIARQIAATGPIVDIPASGEMTASVLRLLRGAIKKDFRDQFESEMAMFAFSVTLERWAQQRRDGVARDGRLVDEVRSRIIAKLPRAIDVLSLAAEFGMSRSHFSRLFRDRTGLTPGHFATEVRIEEAARLLLDSNEPQKAIASACGFASANHFCKVFRRLRKLSPAAFRAVRG
jgi:AraC-like DNA-binding protein